MSLLATLDAFCEAERVDNTWWVAYSGGLDSHVLLHTLARLRDRYGFRLRAIHINHQISPQATAWAQHCADVCATLAVTLTTRAITIDAAASDGLEATARAGRYAVFRELLAAGDILLAAHHEEDQAETVLLQLCRGAGLKGLAAMPARKRLGAGTLVRPLLAVTRATLQAYAREAALSWVDDESNADTRWTRNFLRHDIMPPLSARWPQVSHTLARVARHCAEAQRVLDLLAAEDGERVRGKVADTLSVEKLKSLSPERQRQVLRYWLRQQGYPVPGLKRLLQLQHDMLQAASDRVPHVTWRQVELRRFQDDLYALPIVFGHVVSAVYAWDGRQAMALPGLGQLEGLMTAGQGLQAGLLNVSIRFRQGGEVLRLPGRDCHHALKKLFQAWRVPTWLRDRIPLVFVGEVLAAVVGYGVAADFLAAPDQAGVVFSLQPAKK